MDGSSSYLSGPAAHNPNEANMKPRHEARLASLHNHLRESYRTNETESYREGMIAFCLATLVADGMNKYDAAAKTHSVACDCARLYRRAG